VTRTPSTRPSARLRLHVVLLAALAGLLLVYSAWQAPKTAHGLGLFPLWFACLIAVANVSVINVRIRTVNQGVAPTSAAILVCIAYASPAWCVICTATGIFIAKLVTRLAAIKVAFNVAKETLAASAATMAAAACGLVPVAEATRPGEHRTTLVAGLAAAAVTYAFLDEVVSFPVLALASGTSVWRLVRTHWDIRLAVRFGSLCVAVATVFVLDLDKRLLLALPPLVYGLHLLSATRIRARTEREAWQRLAAATDEFNAVDLDGVLRTAVTRAADLFSVDDVDVELYEPARLVRGSASGISFDGPPEEFAGTTSQEIPIALASSDEQPPVGQLRLRIRGQVTLSEREHYTLRTFAAALCTAVRNATAFAETKRLAESHAKAAAADPLTGLANRRKLHEYGDQVAAVHPPNGVTALLLVDLNHFKEINDTLGHSAGDRVLVEVGRRLAAAAQPDDLVARLGGDEFAIFFVGLPAPALAVPRAQAMLAAINPPMELDGMRISIEACGGVAIANGTDDVVELLRRADVAMYHAKRDGQRVAVYNRSRDTADIGLLALGGDLARAIVEQQFTVDFQPIVDLGTGDVIAAEALARWHHPDRGDLRPDRFLDAIERSGQLPAFAEAVLDQALAAVAQWREAGFDLAVAVNVSPRSLLDPNFPSVVRHRLEAHDVPPAALVIELTESVTLSQLEVVDQVLTELRETGVQLALDDFGTGYSSLATLARVPVHELKIDRSFVADMDSPTPAAVVRSTIELGRSLDLLVVAEGVESAEQRKRLWELGCPTGQGHLFARPMPAARLMAALVRGCDGRPGALAPSLHEAGAVIRMPPSRRGRGQQRHEQSG
jgi:diguanylate cyclase (GGDEF)-like protein